MKLHKSILYAPVLVVNSFFTLLQNLILVYEKTAEETFAKFPKIP